MKKMIPRKIPAKAPLDKPSLSPSSSSSSVFLGKFAFPGALVPEDENKMVRECWN